MIIAIYWTIILTSNSLAYMYIAMKSRSDSDNLSHDTWKGFKLLLILLVRPKGLYIKFLVRIWCIVPAECNETCVHIGTLLQAVTTGLLLFFLCHSWLFIDQSSNQLQAASHYSPVVLWCAHRWKTDDCVCVCVRVCVFVCDLNYLSKSYLIIYITICACQVCESWLDSSNGEVSCSALHSREVHPISWLLQSIMRDKFWREIGGGLKD